MTESGNQTIFSIDNSVISLIQDHIIKKTMKISKLILVLFLGLMALTSCDKELIKNEPDLPPMTEAEYDLVEADLTTEVEGELRLHQVIEDEGTGRILKPFMAEKDLYIYVVIRGGESSNRKYAFQTLKFTKVRGQNKVTYKGQIKVPKNITTGLEIAAIVLNEEGGETYTYVVDANHALAANYKDMVFVNQNDVSLSKIENVPNSSGEKKVRTLIPYLANWTTIQIVNKRLVIKDGVSGQPQCLHFHPSGVLLRFKIQNMKSTPVTVSKVKIESNVLRGCWGYDFTRSTFTGQVHNGQELLEGLVNVGGPTSLDAEYPLPGAPVTVQPGQKSDWYYIWLMPIKEKADLTGDTKIYLQDGSEKHLAFTSIKKDFALKAAIPLTLKYKDGATPQSSCEGYPNGLLPLDYVASHNLKRVGSGAWAIEGNNQAPDAEIDQIYELLDVEDLLRSNTNELQRTIGGQKYYIPQQEDWSTILPHYTTLNNPAPTYERPILWPANAGSQPNFMGNGFNDEIRIQGPGGPVYKGKSYFMSKLKSGSPNGFVYALRLVNSAEHKNCKALAYRYEFSGYNQLYPYNSYVKIWSRYVGQLYKDENITPERAKELLRTEIATDEFWTPGSGKPISDYSNNNNPIVLPAKGIKEFRSGRWSDYRDLYGSGSMSFVNGHVGSYGVDNVVTFQNSTGQTMVKHFLVAHSWVYDFENPQKINMRVRTKAYAPPGQTYRLKASIRLFKQDPPARR